jgi:hypothetical protein
MAELDIVLVKKLKTFSADDFRNKIDVSMTLAKKLHQEVVDLMIENTV